MITLTSFSSTIPIAKAHSGASRHYFTEKDVVTLKNCTPGPGPTVHLPNGETITSTKNGYIPCTDKLSPRAQLAQVFSDL